MQMNFEIMDDNSAEAVTEQPVAQNESLGADVAEISLYASGALLLAYCLRRLKHSDRFKDPHKKQGN